jgi:hypothetical protein
MVKHVNTMVSHRFLNDNPIDLGYPYCTYKHIEYIVVFFGGGWSNQKNIHIVSTAVPVVGIWSLPIENGDCK